MSHSVETARDLVEKLFKELPARDADAFAAHMAPDAVFEMPFTVPGLPERLEGREQIREFLAARWGSMSGIEVHGIHPFVHETSDPAVFVIENEVDVTRPDRGREQVRSSVNVVHVHDGQVTLFRDYMNTARLMTLPRD
ncbi:nuclear transport factor 2 family protein [Nocardia yamanashiensis]|uniref:nuclear transport factor 2 family protein n=1 Tax=Nocardia yamanashiensis TaxID=209247 RepID=UPI001E3405B3|nr:nuclear transport factor 2 family protein [Nocardia yamanashiensis]UGT41725.1 nuclear transport factor 2 family protein [Nocardia yamanashiensis]